jgi:FkbH-like protein
MLGALRPARDDLPPSPAQAFTAIADASVSGELPLKHNVNSIDWALARAALQPRLFNSPRRFELSSISRPDWPCRLITIRVHRNHGFEAVATATRPYAAWNGLAFNWTIGHYDNGLAFDLATKADIELIWLDAAYLARLDASALAYWLLDRLRALRGATTHPIVVLITSLAAQSREILECAAIPGVHLADLSGMESDVGDRWFDMRTKSISGTRLSNAACLRVAQELACRWLPACVLPPRKAIVVDLDDTLVRGVLAEDGVAGVELTDGHAELQHCLRDWHDSGVLLALVSRNERADIEALFSTRREFPLRRDHFSAIEATWSDKGQAIDRIATAFRIVPEAMIYVDDNPGDLAHVASGRQIFTVHAREDARETASALMHSAGLFRWRRTSEEALRAADLRAAPIRAALSGVAPSRDEYLRSLDIHLEFLLAPRTHIARIAELSLKTNQFNLALRRFNESELVLRLDDRAGRVMAIRLSDRLSESGIVAAIVGRRDGPRLRVEDVFVSCRALGREIEDIMLARGVALLGEDMGDGEGKAEDVHFDVSIGPRNQPARDWLARYTGSAADSVLTGVKVRYDIFVANTIPSGIVVDVTQ